MKNKPIEYIFDSSFEEFQEAVASEISFKGAVSLAPQLLGGWSSLNFLGYEDGIPKFVVKMPSILYRYDYGKISSIHDTLSEFEICPAILGRGEIGIEKRIPFLVLEYIEGKVCTHPKEINKRRFSQLSQTLETLGQIDIPSLYRHDGSIQYFKYLTKPLIQKTNDWKKEPQTRFVMFLEKFLSNLSRVKDSIRNIQWDSATIHGDLSEGNIVFQSNKAVLLDLEECCVAEKFYDIVYLAAQSFDSEGSRLYFFERKKISKDHWQELEIMALTSVISWSFRWLTEWYLGRIEPNIAARVDTGNVLDYIEKKMTRLFAYL